MPADVLCQAAGEAATDSGDEDASIATADLTCLEDSLRHSPTVAAWWSSRVTVLGPAQERSDLVFVPTSKASGLHKVHPTWAGTFVLAALSVVFPTLQLVLLDRDCIPVILFEVADHFQTLKLTIVFPKQLIADVKIPSDLCIGNSQISIIN